MFLKFCKIHRKTSFAESFFWIKKQTGNLKLSEAATGDVLLNKTFLKILLILQEKPVLESLFNKVTVLGAWNFIKKTLTQVISCENCKHFKNNYFEEHLFQPASNIPGILAECSLNVVIMFRASREHIGNIFKKKFLKTFSVEKLLLC